MNNRARRRVLEIHVMVSYGEYKLKTYTLSMVDNVHTKISSQMPDVEMLAGRYSVALLFARREFNC